MILRKPYAFLIKHFKLIHLILTGLLLYVIIKSNRLLSFLTEYINSRNYSVIDNLSSIYIGPYVYLSIFLIMVISFVIFMLMKTKDKPLKYYVFTIIYYLIFIIDLIFISTQLDNISINKVNTLLLRISRDSLLVLFLGQIPFFLISLVRAIGFNIKKFNFQKDLIELEADEKDNEEFELDIDVDSFDVKTRTRRRLRLIRYVIKENKLIILFITGIILIVSGVFIHNNVYLKNKVYKENAVISSNGLNLKVIDSYQLSVDNFGNDISNEKFSYTVARVKIKNITNNDLSFSIKNFVLKLSNGKIYSADLKSKDYFLGLGNTSSTISISQGNETIIIVIFKIDEEDIKSKKVLEYTSGYKINNGERIYNSKKISLNPKENLKNVKVSEVKLGEKLVFDKSILGNSSIVINSFEISNKFTYSYKQCISECYQYKDFIEPKVNTKYNPAVIKMNLDINIDKELYNDSLVDNLIPVFAHVRYIIEDKEYTQPFNMANITPNNNLEDRYYEIKSDVSKASNIYLDFIVLDKTYTYVLK